MHGLRDVDPKPASPAIRRGSCANHRRDRVGARGQSVFATADTMNAPQQRELNTPMATIYPLGFAIGVAVALVGLVIDPLVISSIGIVIATVFGALWARDATTGLRDRASGSSPKRASSPRPTPGLSRLFRALRRTGRTATRAATSSGAQPSVLARSSVVSSPSPSPASQCSRHSLARRNMRST